MCGDSGWKQVGSGPNQRVTRCDCRLRDRAERLLQRARIPHRYEPCELSNFDVYPGEYQSIMARAHLQATRFVEEYPLDRNAGLLLVGRVGVGKTHLAVGIIKELIRTKNIPCLFYDYRELLKEIQNSYNASVQTTEMEVLRPVFDTPVLVLDELGAVKPTDWVWDTVSHILNTRYNDQRTTIITTNYPDQPAYENGFAESERSALQRATRKETLGDRIGERMRSRLHEMCRMVVIDGKDFRLIHGAGFRSPELT